MAEDINILKRFFLTKGTFIHLHDGNIYILDRCFCLLRINLLAIDSTGNNNKLYFILATDVAISCNYVKR